RFAWGAGVQQAGGGAVAGAILGDVGEVEHTQVAHAFFELADARVHKALAFLGEFVLGVFREVTVGASDGNFLGKVDAEFVLKRGKLFLDFLFNLLQWVRHGELRPIRAGRNQIRTAAPGNS